MTRIDKLEARITLIENDTKTTDATAIRTEIASLAKTVEKFDNCEIIIDGVPCATDLGFQHITEKTLSAIGLSNLTPHVINTRKWLPKSRKKQSQCYSPKPRISHHKLPTDSLNDSQNDSMSVVVEFSSPHIRDKVLRNSKLLRETQAHQLFGSRDKNENCENGRVSIRPLWPKDVYNLWRSAHACYSDLNYARPVIKNLTVFMRETYDSSLIRIDSPHDLTCLKPRK